MKELRRHGKDEKRGALWHATRLEGVVRNAGINAIKKEKKATK